jgi:hypothetical protein
VLSPVAGLPIDKNLLKIVFAPDKHALVRNEYSPSWSSRCHEFVACNMPDADASKSQLASETLNSRSAAIGPKSNRARLSHVLDAKRAESNEGASDTTGLF